MGISERAAALRTMAQKKGGDQAGMAGEQENHIDKQRALL